MYAGCVSGAIQKDAYLGFIADAGFENITLPKQKDILIPDDILSKYFDAEKLEQFKSGSTGIFSVTVFAQKPGINSSKPKVNVADVEACVPGGGCC